MLAAVVPSDGFALIKGKTVVGGLRKPKARYMHCDWSKCWLFTGSMPDKGYISVRAMMLEETDWRVPFMEDVSRVPTYLQLTLMILLPARPCGGIPSTMAR